MEKFGKIIALFISFLVLTIVPIYVISNYCFEWLSPLTVLQCLALGSILCILFRLDLSIQLHVLKGKFNKLIKTEKVIELMSVPDMLTDTIVGLYLLIKWIFIVTTPIFILSNFIIGWLSPLTMIQAFYVGAILSIFLRADLAKQYSDLKIKYYVLHAQKSVPNTFIL